MAQVDQNNVDGNNLNLVTQIPTESTEVATESTQNKNQNETETVITVATEDEPIPYRNDEEFPTGLFKTTWMELVSGYRKNI